MFSHLISPILSILSHNRKIVKLPLVNFRKVWYNHNVQLYGVEVYSAKSLFKEGCFLMFNMKKLLAAATAVVISFSFVMSAEQAVYAVSSTANDEKTFDGRYSLTDTVEIFGLFSTLNDSDTQDKLETALKRKFGGKALDEVTFGDLAKVTSLDLNGLSLTDVPSCINYMVNLTRLDLSSNLLQSDALKELSLLGCTKLSNINISDNYLTTIPSWFLSDRVTRGDITKNFVDSENPRCIIAQQSTYYLMNGETVDEESLKTQILKSIRLNDGKLLPDIFFDYNDIDISDPDSVLKIANNDWSGFIDANGTVTANSNTSEKITVQLFDEPNNANTKATVTIYLMSDNDIASLKTRINTLITECEPLDKKNYTENSWTKFEQALDTANAIIEYEEADGQMLAKALEGLSNAKNNLRDSTEQLQNTLKGLITVGGKYKQDEYTPLSWETFSSALEELKKVSSDKNATLEDAQRAVKRFQNAQADLIPAELKVPEKILKSEFEKIFGESSAIVSSGITIEGTRYKWIFSGKDLEKVADFNPEIKDTDAAEPDILIEAGSKSGYRMFATAGKEVFPGKATLELDVSNKFSSGTFYLYKWDSSAKRSLMVGTASVTDGTAIIPLTEGGVYYLCRNVQNFELKSRNYEVDKDKKTITIPPTIGVNVFEFKNSFEFGAYTTILDEDGKSVPSYSNVKTGMTINAPNMDEYTIKLIGDIDASGGVDFDDVSGLIHVFLNGAGENDTAEYDLDGDGSVTFEDINLIIEYFLMVI